MKYCQKCGSQLEDADLFCTSCGEKQGVSKQMQESSKKQKEILVIGVLVVLLFSIIGVVYYTNSKKEDDNSTVSKNIQKDIDVAKTLADLICVASSNEYFYEDVLMYNCDEMVSYNDFIADVERSEDESVYNAIKNDVVPPYTCSDVLGNGDEVVTQAGYYFYYDKDINQVYVFVKSFDGNHPCIYENGYYELYPVVDDDLLILLNTDKETDDTSFFTGYGDELGENIDNSSQIEEMQGFYIGHRCWAEIDGYNIKVWYENSGIGEPSYNYSGILEDDGNSNILIYFTEGWHLNGNDPGRNNPLKADLVGGGNVFTISSDKSNWVTDTFNRVSEEEYRNSFDSSVENTDYD